MTPPCIQKKAQLQTLTHHILVCKRKHRCKHSHNPLLSHPACHKSEQRRAKSDLGAWGGNIFSECRFLYRVITPISNSNPLKCTACSAFRSLPCNGQLAPKTTDRTETSEASQGWEGGVGERGFELEIGDIRRYRNRHSLKISPP